MAGPPWRRRPALHVRHVWKGVNSISAYHGYQSVHSDASDDTEPEDSLDAAGLASGAEAGDDAA